MKEKKNIIAIVAVLLISVIVFAGCSGNKSKDADKSPEKASISQNKEEATASDETSEKAVNAEKEEVKSDDKAEAPKADKKSDDKKADTKQPESKKVEVSKEEGKTETTTAPENTKYGDAEVYKTEEGVPAAKTESGKEVELTGENLQKLFAEYEKEKGSGSEKEKELLDQLQLIFDIQGSVQ